MCVQNLRVGMTNVTSKSPWSLRIFPLSDPLRATALCERRNYKPLQDKRCGVCRNTGRSVYCCSVCVQASARRGARPRSRREGLHGEEGLDGDAERLAVLGPQLLRHADADEGSIQHAVDANEEPAPSDTQLARSRAPSLGGQLPQRGGKHGCPFVEISTTETCCRGSVKSRLPRMRWLLLLRSLYAAYISSHGAAHVRARRRRCQHGGGGGGKGRGR
jgi:hypothetical protein